MKLIHAQENNVYSFILTEDEWYSGTDQQRVAWIEQIKREAAEVQCSNLNILVNPDIGISISPVSHMHRVWNQSSSTYRVAQFVTDLQNLIVNSGLTFEQKQEIAKKVFGL